MLKLIRLILIFISIAIISVGGIIVALFSPRNPTLTPILAKIMSKVVLFIAGIEEELVNPKDFSKETPLLFISNHQDNLDVLLIASALIPRTVSIGKKSIVYFPFFGQLFWLCGNIIINRSKSEESISILENAALDMRKYNKNIWVMPEGTRNKGRPMGEFKRGAFHLAKKANVGIVPVVIEKYMDRIDLNSIKKMKVKVKYLPLISKEEVKNLSAKELAIQTRNSILQELKVL